jgi:Spy/CpxP family protein refolding chaperone
MDKENSVIKKIFLAISMAAIVALTGVSLGQTSSQTPSNNSGQRSVDQDINLLRQDIRSHKKQIIAANLQLTDAEAEKFWPLYDQYTAELVKINDAKYAVIKEYAINYDTLTDDKALALTRQLLDVDQQVAQLRIKYVPLVNKVISGKKTALFFQMDRRLLMLIDLQLAEQIPMVQP